MGRTIIIKHINLCNANSVEFGIVCSAYVPERGIILEQKMLVLSYLIFVTTVMTNF